MSPGRPVSPKLLSMSLSTQGLTSFVLFICSPLGGLSQPPPSPGCATGCSTPVWLQAGPGGPGVAGRERRAAQASGLLVRVHVPMSDDSCCGRSWCPSPCQGRGAPVACANAPRPPRAARGPSTGRPRRLLQPQGPLAWLAGSEAREARKRELGGPHRLVPAVNTGGRGRCAVRTPLSPDPPELSQA